MTEKISDSLEKFICQLYDYKNDSNVDKIRFKMFQTKDTHNLSLLPPCKSNLKHHTIQAINVACMYKNLV